MDSAGSSEDASKHARLPHFFRKQLLMEDDYGACYWIERWDLILEELRYLQRGIQEQYLIEEDPDFVAGGIKRCITMYTYPNGPHESNINILRDALKELYRKPNGALDVVSTIVFIIDSVLMTPALFPEPITLLDGQSENIHLVLTKEQICCILANAFFCTFPEGERRDHEFKKYPRINFSSLYDDSDNFGTGWRAKIRQAKVEKLKCFFNYFSRMKDRLCDRSQPFSGPNAIVYERSSLSKSQIPAWDHVKARFGKLSVFSEGVIEDQVGTLQVDFANEFVGGGTLGNGAAMEEIRFACCPELVAAQLFTKVLGPLDSLHVHQFEQFSSYRGYSASFRYAGSFEDTSVNGNHVVAMDAYRFRNNSIAFQLEKQNLNRELNKCISSFHSSGMFELQTVSSGKWGCGIFNGDPLLKCLLQWMAASYCGKELQLYTIGDLTLMSNLKYLESMFSEYGTTVGDLYLHLNEYRRQGAYRGTSLMDFLKSLVVPVPVPTTESVLNNEEGQVEEKVDAVAGYNNRRSWGICVRSWSNVQKIAKSTGDKVWGVASFIRRLFRR